MDVITEAILNSVAVDDNAGVIPVIWNQSYPSSTSFQSTSSLDKVAILECDLCLEEFDYECDIEINELFSKTKLMEEYSQETELKDGQFVTDLEGSDSIDIYDLLYQSVIIDFPNKKVCGINCKGGDIFIRDESYHAKETDPRLEIFKTIKVEGKK